MKIANIKLALTDAMIIHSGNIALSCSDCKVARNVFLYFLESDPSFKRTMEEIREEIIDLEESMVLEHIFIGKSEAMLRWHLEQKAKDRGYGQNQKEDVDTVNMFQNIINNTINVYNEIKGIDDKSDTGKITTQD